MADTKLRLPEKRTMNLYQSSKELSSKEKRVKNIAAILIIVLLLVTVVGRYGMLIYKSIRLSNSKAELATLESQLVDYDVVKAEYDRYTRNFMTSDERALETRQSFMNVANSAVGGHGRIEYFAVMDNEASIRVAVDDLDNVALIRRNLENNSAVKSVTVYNADNRKRASTSEGKAIVATINFTMGSQINGED